MSLSTVLGQARAVSQLQAALRGDSVPHAYLFTGPDGVGKELAARAFVQALLCAQAPKVGCGECATCRRVLAHNHPDITWLMPDEERIARKLAGRSDFDHAPSRDIRVEQVRQLQERLALRALEGSWRVAILTPAEQLNAQAQNALLKTLEEPPRGAVLLLITAAPDRLLPTLRSRCVRAQFGPLPIEIIRDRVQAARKVDAATAELLAVISGGSLSRALSFDIEALQRRTELITAFEQAQRGGASAVLRFAEAYGGSRPEAEHAVRLLMVWTRDVAVAGVGGAVANRDLEQLAREVAARTSPAILDRRHGLLDDALIAISQRNGSPRLQLERMLIEMGA
jgi:DNA polymerase III subunit delta'